LKNLLIKIIDRRSPHKETDLFIGFFGYEILNNLIEVKIKKQKTIISLKEYFTNLKQK